MTSVKGTSVRSDQLRRRGILAGTVAGWALSLPGWARPDDADRPMPVFTADRLVDSIGVNIHAWPGNSYIAGNRWQGIVLPALRRLGVRHVRDGMGTDAGVLARHKALAAQGLKLTLITEPQHTDSRAMRGVIETLGRTAIGMLEGINEPDGYWSSQPGTRPSLAIEHQRQLYALARPLGIPVAASALISVDKVSLYAEQRGHADFGNIHPYSGGRMPETTGWGENGYGSLEYGRDRMARVLAGRDSPFIASETGYNNAISPAIRRAGGNAGCPEDVAAAYEARLFLHYLNRGVTRSFHYELLDQGTDPDDIEMNFGWLRHDGTAKPAFQTMSNLIAVMADPGPGFAPRPLAARIAEGPDDVMSCLLSRRDGSWLLALWRAASLWDVNRFERLTVSPEATSLRLPALITQAALCKPDQSREFRSLDLRNGRVDLQIDGQVSLLHLR